MNTHRISHTSSTDKALDLDPLVYEEPLNERIRNFLRLERLLTRLAYHGGSDHAWDMQIALQIILDILAIAGRWDIKSEITKELERQQQSLRQWQNQEGVTQKLLDAKLNELQLVLDHLYRQTVNISQALNQDFIHTLKQRSSVAPDICSFDMPSYHHWLHLNPALRKKLLEECTGPLQLLRQSLQFLLNSLRDSETLQSVAAENGFYQQVLNPSKPPQLIRIGFANQVEVFPEISAGKHRFSIRFFKFISPLQRPEPADQDIAFLLACCKL